MNTLIATVSVYSDLLNQAATFAGSVLLFALTALATKLFQRAGIKLTQEQEAAFDAIVAKGIAFAEEAAHKKIDSIKLTGDDKLGIALKFVMSQIDAQGLQKRAEKAIEDRIHSVLGTTRKPDAMSGIVGQLMSFYSTIFNKPADPTAVVVEPAVAPAAPAVASAAAPKA